ncbi:hypothetical protein COB64_01850 [Candidatus Wolfebacteria bacterium]|nr:MAG: hypothetical protein COB64_01850 [Candidatus Wolfebacteria bacterium]
MENNIYWLSSGPSREGMFDSLRLGLKVEIKLCKMVRGRNPKGNILDHGAKITAIKAVHKSDGADWGIELWFKGRFSSNKPEHWSGTYSTRRRTGTLSEKLSHDK